MQYMNTHGIITGCSVGKSSGSGVGRDHDQLCCRSIHTWSHTCPGGTVVNFSGSPGAVEKGKNKIFFGRCNIRCAIVSWTHRWVLAKQYLPASQQHACKPSTGHQRGCEPQPHHLRCSGKSGSGGQTKHLADLHLLVQYTSTWTPPSRRCVSFTFCYSAQARGDVLANN